MRRLSEARPGSIETVLTGLFALVLLPGDEAARAAPHWSRPAVVARATCPKGGSIGGLQAAGNARGDALLAWVEEGCGSAGRWRVVVVSRTSGHRFGRPRVLHSGSFPYGLQLGAALDARAGATIAWTRAPERGVYYPGHGVHQGRSLFVATRRPGERFGKRRLLDPHGAAFALAADPQGDTVLTWTRLVPPTDAAAAIVAAIRPAGRTRFGATQTLSGPVAGSENGAVAIARDGTALASWSRADGSALGCCAAIEAAIRLPRGSFGTATPVAAPSRYHTGQAVAIAGRGAGVVTWTVDPNKLPPFHPGEPQERGGVFASRWNGQAFAALVALVTAFDRFRDPDVLLARGEDPIVEWDQGGRECGVSPRFAMALPAAGRTGTPRPIGLSSGILAAVVSALDPSGRLIAVWERPPRSSTGSTTA